MRLYWRIVLVNGVVFAIGTSMLAALLIAVSVEILLREAAVLALGAVLLLVVNGLLLRVVLAPLERLREAMSKVDLLKPSRVEAPGIRDFQPLVETFNAMLGRLEKERVDSAARALRAQENERRRIAQDLHDETGQSLTVVLLALKRAIDAAHGAVDPELLLAQEAARASIEELRRTAGRLRPGVLEDLGLSQALVSMATESAAATGLQVRRDVGAVRGLGPEVELALFRIAQEAVTNVVRHAGATRIKLSLSQDEHGVTLVVEDDGRGRQAAEGSGIRGMRERALLIEGSIDVCAGARGIGTQVRCVVPAMSGVRPAGGDPP